MPFAVADEPELAETSAPVHAAENRIAAVGSPRLRLFGVKVTGDFASRLL